MTFGGKCKLPLEYCVFICNKKPGSIQTVTVNMLSIIKSSESVGAVETRLTALLLLPVPPTLQVFLMTTAKVCSRPNSTARSNLHRPALRAGSERGRLENSALHFGTAGRVGGPIVNRTSPENLQGSFYRGFEFAPATDILASRKPESLRSSCAGLAGTRIAKTNGDSQPQENNT
ncbi:hypothetical protein PoB_006192100 [Plakobranchus ocellatus]|uniref:Uncharacterized protein n=1 Tax=Plakobranchus ocellatus TaxID=259542 RepID=A0AAV4CUQ6_9GAST|nr:hypothetical protein PoB_006192100 [Plakobranchus ocellatus]